MQLTHSLKAPGLRNVICGFSKFAFKFNNLYRYIVNAGTPHQSTAQAYIRNSGLVPEPQSSVRGG
jgi:hypothetical protein